MAEGIIAGVLKLLLLWVGFIAAAAIAALSTKRTAWRIGILFIGIASIPMYVAIEVSDIGRRFHAEREKNAYQSEAQAFQAYCAGRKRSLGKVASSANSAVEISYAGASMFELPASFNAGQLANEFTSKPAYRGQLCENSRLKYLEGRSVYFDFAKKQFRFPLCPVTQTPDGKSHPGYFPPEEIARASAPYKLVFSAPFEKTSNPVFPRRAFSKIQVRLLATTDNKVVAEDTLFLLGPIFTGNSACPNAFAQIHDLLLNAYAID